MRKTIVSLSLLAIPASHAAYAMDAFDAQLHSAVTEKVQQDHAIAVKEGKVGRPISHSTSVSTTGSTATSAASTATHPNQVQDLRRRKHKTPAPNTHGGHHQL